MQRTHPPFPARGPEPSGAAALVELIILDVDGVLTDGSIYLDDQGFETKRFNVRDGFGIKLWQKLGFQVAIITGRSGAALKYRATELGIEHVVQGAADKGAALDTLLATMGIGPERVACIGDDWPELVLMRRVGYGIAVADADERIKAAAAMITRNAGGHGAVREAIEGLIAAKGLMAKAVSLYDVPHAGKQ